MAGQFSPSARPLRPGAYFDFEAAQPQPILVNTGAVVALSFTHNWGPENQVIELDQFSDFTKYFGDGGASLASPTYTPGYTAVRMAFTGEGLPGRGGAGQVLGYRMVGTGGVASSLVLQNTTPATALTLTAKYKGSYGNNISAAVVANAQNPSTQLDLQIYVEGFLTETFTFLKADITSLAALINHPTRGSKWVTTTGTVITGTALATVVTPAALTGGNDGATLSGSDFTNMLAAFGTWRFGVFATQDIAATTTWTDATGSAALTSLITWQAGLNSAGKRFMTIIGGSSADTASSAGARSALANDPNVINIGVGSFSDSVVGPLSSSQLAPRLAGIIAARGGRQGLSFARLQGVSIVTGASDSDILQSLSGGGFMTLARDSNSAAPVRFEKGLTTYTGDTPAMPAKVFANPKFILTMDQIENDLTGWAEEQVIGQMPVDDNTVQYVIGYLKGYLKTLEADQLVQPGWTVGLDPLIPMDETSDFIPVRYGVGFIRDMEQILNTVVVQ